MAHGDHASEYHVGHIVPLRLLILVGLVLTVLTVITVSVTDFDFGYRTNLMVALSIATVKGSLVALYFMHLRWDRPFNAIIFVVSMVLLALFLGLAMLDTSEYQPELIPGYAPEIAK
jgi:cytochrome c oxidase subunit 4